MPKSSSAQSRKATKENEGITIITAIVSASALLSASAMATQRGLKADNSNKNENAAGKNSDECRELAGWVARRIGPSVEFFLENVAQEVVSGNDDLPFLILYLQKFVTEQADALGVIVGINLLEVPCFDFDLTDLRQLESGVDLITLLEVALLNGVSPLKSSEIIQSLRNTLSGYNSNYTGPPEEKNEVLSFLILFASSVVLTLLSGFDLACGGPVPGEGSVPRGDVKNVSLGYMLELQSSGGAIFGLPSVFYYADTQVDPVIPVVKGFIGNTEISLVGADDFVDAFIGF